jgi:deoxyribonuclease-4
MNERLIGGHPSDEGGLHMTAVRGGNAGMTAMQVFTAIPRFYGDRSNINPTRAARFREELANTSIRPEHVLVHAAYVLNTATAKAEPWSRAAGGLMKEVERSAAIGAGAICFHPGSATEGDPEQAVERVARAMTLALESVETGPRLLVENTAGAGRTVGRTAEEVAAILAHLPAHVRSRAGYGLDTCHLYASGYDITESESALRGLLDTFEKATGEAPSFFHLNDSGGELGSNRDRHALIGEGCIGIEPFRWLLRDPRTRDVPLIFETPDARTEVARDDPTPDPNEVAMLTLLRSLLPET